MNAYAIRPVVVLINLFLALSWQAAAAGAAMTLRIHPYLTATELHARFGPLVRYLSEKTDETVEIVISKNYQNHIELVGTDQFDLAYMGPASYVKMTDRYGAKILLACLKIKGSPFFHGMIVCRTDADITSLADLRGRRFAFGDPVSTMSHYVPYFMLQRAGITKSVLGDYKFLGTHHNVALAVLGGYFDAGGVKEEIYYQYKGRGLRLLAKGPPIPEHLFVIRSSLPRQRINRIRTLLLELEQQPRGAEILTAIKSSVTGLAPVTDSDYDTLREIIKTSAEGSR